MSAETTGPPAGSLTSSTPDQRGPSWRWLVPGLVALGALVATAITPVPELVGAFGLVSVLALMALRAPIAIAMIVPSLVGIQSVLGWRATERLLSYRAFDAASDWSLSVIPMFVLMGLLLWHSGVTTEIYAAMDAAARRVPGRLAVVTNLSGGMLASISGDTVATTYALGRVGIPEMLRAGYDPRLAASSVIMAGTGGQLMPPSILLVIYAGAAGVSVGPQLLAGVAPALVLVAAYTVALVGIAMLRPQLTGSAAAAQSMTGGARLRALLRAWPAPALVVIILGGIFAGVLTATEAGAAGAVTATLLTLWRKRGSRPLHHLRRGIGETVGVTAAVMFLVIGAVFLTELLRFTGLAEWVAEWVRGSGLGRVPLLLLIMAVYLVLGMFMSTLAVVLITVPILAPVVEAVGVSPLWFGAFVVLLAELGMITPPVGLLTYIVHGVTRDPEVNLGRPITLRDLFTGVLWLMPASVAVLLLMIAFPDFVTWLPLRSGG